MFHALPHKILLMLYSHIFLNAAGTTTTKLQTNAVVIITFVGCGRLVFTIVVANIS